MYSCARVQETGDERVRIDVSLLYCIPRECGGPGEVGAAEGQRHGAERFFLAGDFNMMLGDADGRGGFRGLPAGEQTW